MKRTYQCSWVLFLIATCLLMLMNSTSVQAAPELTIGHYELVASKRITRTVFEYTYKADITNTGSDTLDVSATLSVTAPGVTVLDGQLSFGDVAAGARVTSSDTFAIRQDRSYSLSESQFIWVIDVNPTTVVLPPGVGGIVEGDGGVWVEVPDDSLSYEAAVSISKVALAEVQAPLGALDAAAAVSLRVESSTYGFPPAPAKPLRIAVPDPGLGTDRYIVAREELVDDPDAGRPVPRLVPHDTATVIGNEIVSDGGNGFDGVRGSGLYVFLANFGSGFVEGVVYDAAGPRAGVAVSNDTNTLVDVSDGSGRYRLYINGGTFRLGFFDSLRGSGGTADGVITTSGATVFINMLIAPLPNPPITRDGIRNSGFELGPSSVNFSPTGWQITGAGAVIDKLVTSATVIQPTEGQWMADISTGEDAVGGIGSSLRQRFRVPAGVRTLRLDYNFVSEEFPEFVGTVFDDDFKAIVITPDGEEVFAEVSVNASGDYIDVGDCGFPGGDATCGMTGWREGSVDLSSYAGTGTLIEVVLVFSALDAGDNIYDTHVLVDNIRFSTLWINAKILAGANADRARVVSDIQNTNDVLSQAGILVRLRDVSIETNPGDLLDVNSPGTFECRPALACLVGGGETKLVPTGEELALLGTMRSRDATDLNVYYVKSLRDEVGNESSLGISIQPDDYHDIDYLNTSGIFMADGVASFPPALAHEIGHLIITPERPGSVLEHEAVVGNFMKVTPASPGTLLNRDQSATINDVPVPLLLE